MGGVGSIPATAAAWSVLSRACHHHPYELAPTANELRDVLDIAHRFAAEVTRQSCPRRYYARTSTIRADCVLSKPEGGRNMTTTREKTGFDCVKTTREIRDRLGVELAGMSPEDRVQWLNTRDFSDPLLRRLVNRRRSQEGRGGESAPARSTGSPVPDAIPSVSRQEVSDDEHRLQA